MHPTINICNPHSRVVTKVDTLGIVVPSWPVTPYSSFIMHDTYLDLIWSKYIHSPEPGMSTLQDTCAALLQYTISPSDFIPALAGLAIHSHLAEPLREVTFVLKHLLYAAAEHRQAARPLFDCDHSDFRVVTMLGVPRELAERSFVPANPSILHPSRPYLSPRRPLKDLCCCPPIRP